MESIDLRFGEWWAVALWIVLYGAFLAFLPFYKRSQLKPSGTYLAFVIAYALEMFGVPMSMYMLAWVFGGTLPEGILWGHTLIQVIGYWPMYIGVAISLIGAGLVFVGWRQIYRQYWSKEQGKGQLVTNGIYAYIRHPQYTGFLMITFGMMLEWVTLPLLIMWPILIIVYYRLAKREEADMVKEFGPAYEEYRRRTSMFIPFPRFNRAKPATARS